MLEVAPSNFLPLIVVGTREEFDAAERHGEIEQGGVWDGRTAAPPIPKVYGLHLNPTTRGSGRWTFTWGRVAIAFAPPAEGSATTSSDLTIWFPGWLSGARATVIDGVVERANGEPRQLRWGRCDTELEPGRPYRIGGWDIAFRPGRAEFFDGVTSLTITEVGIELN